MADQAVQVSQLAGMALLMMQAGVRHENTISFLLKLSTLLMLSEESTELALCCVHFAEPSNSSFPNLSQHTGV
jgi:hypothetical protein